MQVTEVFQFLARIVVLPIIPQKNLFASPSSEAPSVALLFYLIISIVQFSRCRQKIHLHVPSKLNNAKHFKHFVLTLGRYKRNLVSPEVSLERR